MWQETIYFVIYKFSSTLLYFFFFTDLTSFQLRQELITRLDHVSMINGSKVGTFSFYKLERLQVLFYQFSSIVFGVESKWDIPLGFKQEITMLIEFATKILLFNVQTRFFLNIYMVLQSGGQSKIYTLFQNIKKTFKSVKQYLTVKFCINFCNFRQKGVNVKSLK